MHLGYIIDKLRSLIQENKKSIDECDRKLQRIEEKIDQHFTAKDGGKGIGKKLLGKRDKAAEVRRSFD